MAVVSLVSVKGSPGVTTAAAALATVAVCAGERAWWVEVDPSGGSGWVRARGSCPASEPALADAARELRQGYGQGVAPPEPKPGPGRARETVATPAPAGGGWVGLAVEAPPGVPAVLAPSSPVAASTVVAQGPARWAEALRAPGIVLVDAGRWDQGQATAPRITGSDVVAVVCRSTVEGAEHARHWVGQLRQVARCPVVAIVVGTSPYSGDEVAAAVGLPLAGVIEWRRADVAALWARGAARPVMRSWLGRSASRTLRGLLAVMTARAAAPPPSRGASLAGRVRQGPGGELHVGRTRR